MMIEAFSTGSVLMGIIPVVIGIILDKEGRYLSFKRLHHQPSPLHGILGGKVETGESEYEVWSES